MPPPRLEALEERALLAVTGIDFLNNGGVRLADFTSVPDDADVLVRVRTQGLRGKIVTVQLYEDDSPFGSDYIGPVSFAVPAASDTVVFRFNPNWVLDGNGLFGDPEFQIWASTSPLETVRSQHLSVRPRTATSPDYDDTLAKAGWLGALVAERVASGAISSPRDVDVYSFSAERGQWVAFDVDVGDDSYLDSYVRVFDAAGRELTANNDGNALTDTMAVESYKRDLEYPLSLPTFSRPSSAFAHYVFPAGTYYVAVSGAGNQTFDPRTGTGDADGSQGRYTLTLTPLTRVTTSTATTVSGELRLANPEHADWRRTVVPVSLKRFADSTGSAINPARFTWILIHGRGDSPAGWLAGAASTAQLLADHLQGDQVLTLDWSAAAASNSSAVGLEGSAWVPLVGQWTQSLLTQLGIPGARVGLIGHSWGTYVGYEIARRGDLAGRGPAAGIVALDPAYGGTGAELLGLQYAASEVNFAEHARRSWAFYGSGSFGSWLLSSTANEAFALDYTTSTTTGPAHDAPRDLFRRLLQVNNAQGERAPALYQFFHLNELLLPRLARPWRRDGYARGSLVEPAAGAVFEGVFLVSGTSSGGGFDLTSLGRLTYVRATDGVEVFLPG